MKAAEGSVLSAVTVPAGAVVKVGDVNDGAGRDWGWTLWVDDADVRLDFTVRQLGTRDGVLELPTAACDAPTASADEGTQVFSVAGPIGHRPYQPMQEPIGEPLRWEVLWFWLAAAVIGIPTAVHAHRKAKARKEEEASAGR